MLLVILVDHFSPFSSFSILFIFFCIISYSFPYFPTQIYLKLIAILSHTFEITSCLFRILLFSRFHNLLSHLNNLLYSIISYPIMSFTFPPFCIFPNFQNMISQTYPLHSFSSFYDLLYHIYPEFSKSSKCSR